MNLRPLLALVLVCSCSEQSLARMRYPKELRQYQRCENDYNETHADQIDACYDEIRAWNKCERAHYEEYPHHKSIVCPTGATLVDQLYELIYGNDCGYARTPHYRPGEPKVEDDCGEEPASYYDCERTSCQRPKSPYVYSNGPDN